jgi:hypothetical protein
MFAVGGVVAALSDHIYGVILGRAIQGAGAISGVVMALLADLTREEQRTKAMATIGASIGLSFGLAFVLGPWLTGLFGLHGCFGRRWCWGLPAWRCASGWCRSPCIMWRIPRQLWTAVAGVVAACRVAAPECRHFHATCGHDGVFYDAAGAAASEWGAAGVSSWLGVSAGAVWIVLCHCAGHHLGGTQASDARVFLLAIAILAAGWPCWRGFMAVCGRWWAGCWCSLLALICWKRCCHRW